MAKKKKSADKPDVRQLGQKSRAGRMMSEFLRAIGSETTETIRHPITGKRELVTKAEAVARKIWEKALGREWDWDEKKYIETEVSLSWMKLLLERVEGKAGGEEASNDTAVVDRISDINRDRLNALAEGDENE